MVIIAILIALFVLFFFVRRHSGPAIFAIIAGLSVYELFGVEFVKWVHNLLNQVPVDIIGACIYVLLIFIFPLLLYVRSARGGVHGLLRIVQAGVIAILLATLLLPIVTKYCGFDTVSTGIGKMMESAKGTVLLVCIAFAYFDVLFSRRNKM